MTITSVFYDGSVTEVDWAKHISRVGSAEYGVLGAGDWKVTAHPTTPLAVNIAAGSGWGHGIADVSSATETVTCSSISSGTRWDLISAYRDWQPSTGGPTIFRKVNGSTSKVIPAGRANTPGTTDDQPLALVQWTAGQTQPTAIADLRCWAGNGGMVAKDNLALDYLTRLGASLRIGETDWIRGLDAGDVATWIPRLAVTTYAALQPSGYLITGNIYSEPAGSLKRITVDLMVTRTGADVTFTTTNYYAFGAVLPTAVRGNTPQKYLPVSISGSTNVHSTLSLKPLDGTMLIRGLAAPYTWTTGSLLTVNCVYYI